MAWYCAGCVHLGDITRYVDTFERLNVYIIYQAILLKGDYRE